MPSFEHHGATIYYEEFGQGFPILTFVPAGLQSVIHVWSEPSAPINPTTEFADAYRVVAMDQRNAGGQSRALLTAADGWDSYTADHIALLEAGFEFDLEAVDLRTKRTASGADFLTVNPRGFVPALAFDDGQVLTENIAILDWISGQAQIGRASCRERV